MASTTQDDGFHEIQLNGKQLVFLFMAVTVVSVVIFLSGVLVGRGVRLDRGPVTGGVDPSITEGPAPAPPVETGNPPITKEEGLKAPGMLGGNPPAENPLKEGEEPSAKSDRPLVRHPRRTRSRPPLPPRLRRPSRRLRPRRPSRQEKGWRFSYPRSAIARAPTCWPIA
jgi:hypothetical protein